MWCTVDPMQEENDNRLLMSDDLRGKVPELDDDILKQYESNFIFGVLEGVDPAAGNNMLGNLVGLALENPVKWDFRVGLETALRFLSRYAGDSPTTITIRCEGFQLFLGDGVLRFPGPFNVVKPKIYDIDNGNRMCTLAVDLTRVSI